jgi:regulation of enolase protein 1 (concanavalin A-like superfamily)
MQWINEPPVWQHTGTTITVTSGPKTDFWRKTHYGFIRDDGHIYAEQVAGDFTATVKVVGQYATLYDQAGLMIRQDETTWMKCGIEYVEGVQYASAVVTRDYSDWSVSPLAGRPAAFWLRVRREGGSLEVEYALDGETYTLLRVTYLTDAPVWVGIMQASPQGEGFTATFEELTITPGVAKRETH